MSQARFEKLSGDIVGIIRVYHSSDTSPPAPYKFFTAIEIAQGVVRVVGMVESDISNRDVTAIVKELVTSPELAQYGLHTLYWVHKDKRQEIDLTAARYERLVAHPQ